MAEQERRVMPRFYLVSRVDVTVPGSGDPLWGAIGNVSRTGIALYIRQPMKPRSKVDLRFRFQAESGREMTETVNATIVWQRGESTGLEFDAPLLAGSPAAQKAPLLTGHIAKKETTGGK